MKRVTSLDPIFRSLKRGPIWIALVLLAAFVVRLLWLVYADPIPVSDFEVYRMLAEGLLEHGQLGYPNPTAHRLPLYPVFLAAMMQISRSIAWLSFTNVLLSTMLVYQLYRLTLWCTSNRRISLVAALLCAFNPTFIFFSPVLASEHLFSLLLLTSLLLLSDQRLNQRMGILPLSILAGILFGAAILTRGEGIFYLPVLVLMIFLTPKRRKQKYLMPFIAVLACVITILPWYLRNHYLVGPGSGLSTTSGINFYFAHNENNYGYTSLRGTVFDGLDETEAQKLGYQLGIEYLSNNTMTRIVKDIARGTVRLYFSPAGYSVNWSTKRPQQTTSSLDHSEPIEGVFWFKMLTLFYYVPLLLGVISSTLLFTKYPIKMWLVLLGIVMMNWVGYAIIFWAKARYRYISEVVFCVMASIALYGLIKFVQHPKSS